LLSWNDVGLRWSDICLSLLRLCWWLSLVLRDVGLTLNLWIICCLLKFSTSLICFHFSCLLGFDLVDLDMHWFNFSRLILLDYILGKILIGKWLISFSNFVSSLFLTDFKRFWISFCSCWVVMVNFCFNLTKISYCFFIILKWLYLIFIFKIFFNFDRFCLLFEFLFVLSLLWFVLNLSVLNLIIYLTWFNFLFLLHCLYFLLYYNRLINLFMLINFDCDLIFCKSFLFLRGDIIFLFDFRFLFLFDKSFFFQVWIIRLFVLNY